MSCVMDASALLKGVEKGDDGDGDLSRRIRPRLAERFGLAAPLLAAWEIGNVVHTKKRPAVGGSAEQRREVVELLLTGVELDEPDGFQRGRTGRMAEDHELTFYDAAYLELAERREGILVTEDQRLLEAGRSELGVDRSLTVAGAFHRIQDDVL